MSARRATNSTTRFVVDRDGGRHHLAWLRPPLHNQAERAARRVATVARRNVSTARAPVQSDAHARQEAELWRARGLLLARSGGDLNQPASAVKLRRAVGPVHGGLRGSARILSRRAGPPPRLGGGGHIAICPPARRGRTTKSIIKSGVQMWAVEAEIVTTPGAAGVLSPTVMNAHRGCSRCDYV